MKEIKFRVWNGNKWIGQFSAKELSQTYPAPHEYGHIDDLIYQQFTGLKDKNGFEIYEGDIVTYESIIKEVIWYEPDSSFRLREKNGNVTMSFNGWVKHCSIIGNIFENKELTQ